ncbi:MAG: MlaD family protein [Solirubrobacteraceae bacterium]
MRRGSILGRRILGVVVLAASVTGLALAWQRPNPFASPEVVRADVADASGLAPIGADVRVAGVPVGKVTDVVRAGNVARLTLTLDPSVGTVRRNATAELRPRLLFEGTAYVELTLGSPSAPALGSATLPTRQTSTYVPLDDALSVLNARTRGNLRTVISSASGLLSGSAPDRLRDVISHAPGLTRDTALVARAAQGPHGTELRAAVASLAHVASAVAAQAPSVRSGLTDSVRTFAALDTAQGRPIGQSLGALPSTTGDLTRGARSASAVLVSVQRLVPRLQPGVRELDPTITAVRPLLRRAVPVLQAFAPTLKDIDIALRGADRGARPALGAIGALTPTLHILRDTLLGVLERRTDLGDPAYLAFLGLFAGGGGASRPFGVDGQGHLMRFGLRFLTGAGLPLPPCSLLQKVSPLVAQLVSRARGCTP